MSASDDINAATAWPEDGRQSAAALAIQRGVTRMLSQQNVACLPEIALPNHRRTDLMALTPKGELWIIEIKSGLVDFQTDKKWRSYLEYCDRFYFAVDPDFPIDVLPDNVGYMLADPYGAEVLREGEGDAQGTPLAAARRSLLTRRLARIGSFRWARLSDPRPTSGIQK
jgi:hypothetical protein